MRERIRFRLAVLRLFRYGGRMVPLGLLLQVVGGLMPVAFIVTTSASRARCTRASIRRSGGRCATCSSSRACCSSPSR
jgi:hypothetical protein